MDISPRTSLVVVQPTPFCNINCSYCYLPTRTDRTRLEPARLAEAIARILAFPTIAEEVTVVWHAGEPLVLGPDYFRQTLACLSASVKGGPTVNHAIQTNGMLISPDWCALFKETGIGVGVSIDGPRHIHDAARVTRSGRGTFDAAMRGIACLQEHDVPFHVISVLTAASLDQPDAMFAFYRDNGFLNVAFNVEEQEGSNASSSLAGGDIEARLVRFLERFIALMQEHELPLYVREFEHATMAIAHQSAAPPNEQVVPFGIISMDVAGDLYTFSPELVGHRAEGQSFSFGNVFRDDFATLRGAERLRSMARDIAAGLDLCRTSCDYFGVCGGGAPGNKLFENGTFASAETLYCRLSTKCMTDVVLRQIEARARPS